MRTHAARSIALLLATLVSASASADQFQWVEERHVEKMADAARLVRRSPSILYLCEPCGETIATARRLTPKRVTFGNVESHGDDYYLSLKADGQELDLAYVFIESRFAPGMFINLARWIGLDATDVSDFVHIDGKGRPIAFPSPALTPGFDTSTGSNLPRQESIRPADATQRSTGAGLKR